MEKIGIKELILFLKSYLAYNEKKEEKINKYIELIGSVCIFYNKCTNNGFTVFFKQNCRGNRIIIEKDIEADSGITLKETCEELKKASLIFHEFTDYMSWSIHETGVYICFDIEMRELFSPFLYF